MSRLSLFFFQVVVCICSVRGASLNGAGFVRRFGIEIAKETIGLDDTLTVSMVKHIFPV